MLFFVRGFARRQRRPLCLCFAVFFLLEAFVCGKKSVFADGVNARPPIPAQVRRAAVSVGWRVPAANITPAGAEFSYPPVDMRAFAVDFRYDLPKKAEKAADRDASSLYLDLRISPTAHSVGRDPNFGDPLDRDNFSGSQDVIGIGVERRGYAVNRGPVRVFLGGGGGLYYVQDRVRVYGVDYYERQNQDGTYTPIPFPPFDSSGLTRRVTPGIRFLFGLEHSSGVFVQADYTVLTDTRVKIGSGSDALSLSVSENALCFRAGYRF